MRILMIILIITILAISNAAKKQGFSRKDRAQTQRRPERAALKVEQGGRMLTR
jgi:hypothetical protein